MSAADKLKTLDEALAARPWEFFAARSDDRPMTRSVWVGKDLVLSKPRDALALVALRNALPELIAVVDKAEKRLSAKKELEALNAKLGEPA